MNETFFRKQRTRLSKESVEIVVRTTLSLESRKSRSEKENKALESLVHRTRTVED